MDAVYLDFRKAFDIVSHSILVSILGCYGLDGWTSKWMKN